MTVNAIFFSRGEMPFILSDTLPTFNGTSAFAPSDFWEGADREQLPNTTLFRKTLLLPPGIAITFAGNAGRIHEVANDISAMWRELPNQERCLEVAREKFRPEHFLGRGVRSISLGVRPYSGENNFNFFAHTTNGLRAESRLLGTCFALGSGQEELIRFLSNYDNRFYKNEEVDQQSCFLLGCEAVSALNNKSMFSPWISRATWGGYIEAFSFSEEAGGFLALPPWLHLLGIITGSKRAPKIRIFAKCFIYDSTKGNEKVIGFDAARNESTLWSIKGIQESLRDGEVERVPGIGHIYGMTFSLISYNEDKDRFAHLNFPFIGQSRDFFIVSSNGDYFYFAVGPGFYESVIEGALRAFPKTRQFRVPENFVLTTFERS